MIEPYFGEFLVSPGALELSINHCSHGCRFCFANLATPGRRVNARTVQNSIAGHGERSTLAARLLQARYPVVVSNRVDPFATSNDRLALPWLQQMAALGIPVAIQTRGGRRAREALEFLPPSVWYVSVSCADEETRERLEPGAPSLEDRWALIRDVTAAGHEVILGLNPLVPEWVPDPKPLLKRARRAGVHAVWIEPLHFSRFQVRNLSSTDREAIGEEVIERAKARRLKELRREYRELKGLKEPVKLTKAEQAEKRAYEARRRAAIKRHKDDRRRKAKRRKAKAKESA